MEFKVSADVFDQNLLMEIFGIKQPKSSENKKSPPIIKVGYALNNENRIMPYSLEICGLKYQYKKSGEATAKKKLLDSLSARRQSVSQESSKKLLSNSGQTASDSTAFFGHINGEDREANNLKQIQRALSRDRSPTAYSNRVSKKLEVK